MTNSMLFEGPNLEDVLHEARTCFGPDVEIEAANRVRRGGVMGFFATEWYEVWARPSASVGENPAMVLLDQEDDPDSFQQMVRNAMADRSLRSGDQNPVETFETAMDHFFGDGEGDTTGGLPGGGAPGAGATRQPVPAGATAAAPAVAAVAPRPAPVVPAVPTAPVAPAPMPTATASPVAGPATMLTAAGPVPITAPPAPAAPIMTAAGPLPTVDHLALDTTPAAVALEDSPRGASVFDEPRAPRTDLLWAMLERLESVPRAPELPTAGVVVFVGPAATALQCARAVGARTGRWNGDVTVLSRARALDGVPEWLLVDDVDDLVTRIARWRQRHGLGAVVIDQSMDAGDRAWADRALAAIAPDQVRLVAEAWRLPEEVGRMAGKLGGVDALEMVEVAGSVEPLAMVDLDIPVSSVEGRAATPELLAAVWLENRRRV